MPLASLMRSHSFGRNVHKVNRFTTGWWQMWSCDLDCHAVVESRIAHSWPMKKPADFGDMYVSIRSSLPFLCLDAWGILTYVINTGRPGWVGSTYIYWLSIMYLKLQVANGLHFYQRQLDVKPVVVADSACIPASTSPKCYSVGQSTYIQAQLQLQPNTHEACGRAGI